MSTALVERPADLDRAGSGGPARRAVVRWAWRLLRREWRQQSLVLALICAAVAATVLGAAVAVNTPPPADAGFGTANHLVQLPGSEPNVLPGSEPNLNAEIASIRARFGTVDVIENEGLATGFTQGAQMRSQDSHGAYGGPMLSLLSGAYPSGADQADVTTSLASTLGLHVGGLWHTGNRYVRIVGLVENPQNLLDNFALFAPGELPVSAIGTAPADDTGAVQATVLFDADAARLAGFHFPGGAAAVAPAASNGVDPAVLVFAVVMLGLVFIGLVASAGFAVLAQRRLRAFGLISSLGASDRNVRLVMVANGAAVGALGALAGVVFGLGLWIAYVPSFSRSVDHHVAWTAMPWWLVAAGSLLAVATATLAARRPARAVARIPVVAALSGRPEPGRPVHRSAVPGAVTFGVGVFLLLTAGGWGGDSKSQLLGLLAVAVGLMLLAPAAIMTLTQFAKRSPIAGRIALRDLARHRARSGPALAAGSFAVLIAMLVTLLASGRYADPVDYFGPNLPGNEVVVYAPYAARSEYGPGGPTISKAEQDRQAAATQRLASSIGSLLDTADVLELDQAQLGLVHESLLGKPSGNSTFIYVATPQVLAEYGIDPASVDPTALLLTSRPALAATSGLRLVYNQDETLHPRIQTLSALPTGTADPNLLVTPYAVRTLKIPTAPAAWLVRAAGNLSALQINTARRQAVAAGLTISVRTEAPSLAQVRNDATVAGILLALGMLAMTVGLIRAESASELRTLAATGARRRTRRSIAAATAGSLGLLAALLGTLAAYVATAAFFGSQFVARMGQPPWFDLLLVLVGLPAAAALGGWIFAAREPASLGRRPLE